MELSTYQRKLLDPRWQRKRNGILQRDDYTCLICGTKEIELHVHHKHYHGKYPWNIEDKYLVTLCCRCHSIVELCKKLKIKPININLVPFSKEYFFYLVNSIFIDGDLKVNRLYVFHNGSGKIRYSGMYFSKEVLELMLKTF